MQPIIGQTLGTVFSSVALIFLLPVYTFLFLFYKSLILDFLYEVFAEKNSKEVAAVLSQTKGAIQSYMVGLLLEALIVAILNLLPYIGGIIAIALPLIIATITKDGFHTQFGIIVAYLVIQFIDN